MGVTGVMWPIASDNDPTDVLTWTHNEDTHPAQAPRLLSLLCPSHPQPHRMLPAHPTTHLPLAHVLTPSQTSRPQPMHPQPLSCLPSTMAPVRTTWPPTNTSWGPTTRLGLPTMRLTPLPRVSGPLRCISPPATHLGPL